MSIRLFGVVVKAIRKNKKCRGPQSDKDAETLSIGSLSTGCSVAPIDRTIACKQVPDQNGCDDGNKTEDEAEITE